ncbi:TetR/AcrR family transcriptional regulator [Ktedonosporobacter rubrisoli]|uniref:TetR/AcrR family transcriptional regulator n=1 Tax=Ktedonosporobacter rubrisoli TaxID=2509675 RepID=A0A4P6JNL6_KTERU|nr:TetR/AcrR family transcriptional regulator [Ktedonosporobacter rubrisoli]QBD76326.1 TetR/AcrR family transcriptional regulator [Ktedonosporobacter rubrisoli]
MPKEKDRVTSRDIKAQERREQILAVAKKLFAENGYHATSMRTLNKALGVAEALTYHYFPGGKLEILQTIIREGRAARFAEIEALASLFRDDLSLREALLLAARVGTTIFTADREWFQIVMRERNWLRREEWITALGAGDTPLQFLYDFFARRMAQGELREMDLRFAFMQFFAGITVYSLIVEDDSANVTRYIERLVDFTANLWSK